jgi:hypothetical protein
MGTSAAEGPFGPRLPKLVLSVYVGLSPRVPKRSSILVHDLLPITVFARALRLTVHDFARGASAFGFGQHGKCHEALRR